MTIDENTPGICYQEYLKLEEIGHKMIKVLKERKTFESDHPDKEWYLTNEGSKYSVKTSELEYALAKLNTVLDHMKDFSEI